MIGERFGECILQIKRAFRAARGIRNADGVHLAAAASHRESESVDSAPDNAKRAPGPTAPTPRWFGKTLKIAAFSGLEKIVNAKARNQETPGQAVEITTARPAAAPLPGPVTRHQAWADRLLGFG